MTETLIYLSLAVIGLAVIITAFLCRKQLLAQPVHLEFSKIGFSFKASALSLSVLLGVAIIGAGAFLWGRGYEAKLAVLMSEKQDLEGEKRALMVKADCKENLWKVFKEFDLRYHLVFEDEGPEDIDATKVTAYYRRASDRAPYAYEHFAYELAPGGLIADIQKLGAGDKIFLVAEYGGQEWKSPTMTMPAGSINMRRSR